MTRETTIGLVVSCSFLCLVGVVIVTKMRPGTGPVAHADIQAEAEVTVAPPAPTPVTGAPSGPPTMPWPGTDSTPFPTVALPSVPPSTASVGSGGPGLEPLGSKPLPLQKTPPDPSDVLSTKEKDVLLTKAVSSGPDPKRGSAGAMDNWGSGPRGGERAAAADSKAPASAGTSSTKEKDPFSLPSSASGTASPAAGPNLPLDKSRFPLPPTVPPAAAAGTTTGGFDKDGLALPPSGSAPLSTGTKAATGTGGPGLMPLPDLGDKDKNKTAGTGGTPPPPSGSAVPGPLASPAATVGPKDLKDLGLGAAPATAPSPLGPKTPSSAPPAIGTVPAPSLGTGPSFPSSAGALPLPPPPVTAGSSSGPGTAPTDKKLGSLGAATPGTPPRTPSLADFSTPPPPIVPPPPPPSAPGLNSRPGVTLERPITPGTSGAGRTDSLPAGVAPPPPRSFTPPAGDDAPAGSRGTGALPPSGQFAQGPPALPFGGSTGPRPLPPVGATGSAVVPPITAPLPSGGASTSVSNSTQVRSWDEESYRCRVGDTFQSVSQAYYHTDKYAQALLMYNRDHLLAADGLRQVPPVLQVGQTLYIPATEVLEKGYAYLLKDLTPVSGPTPPPPTAGGVNTTRSSPVATEGPAAGLAAPTQPGAVASSFQSYVVKTPGGEMIAEIARRTLNNSGRWQEIYRLNPGYLADQKIPAGTTLRLPADARVELDNQLR